MKKEIFISDATDQAIKNEISQAIEKYYHKYNIDRKLIRAIIAQESGGNPFAIRIENHLKKARWYLRIFGKEVTRNFEFCSFGLMQVLFGIAKHNRFMGKPFGLMAPDKSIKYGTKLLKKLMKRYKYNLKDVIAAYNQGNDKFYDINKNGIKDENEKYHNQEYVDSVYAKYRNG